MLILTRKLNEAIIINGNIRVTIVEVRGDRVRIGIEAPKEVPVHREEVQVLVDRGFPVPSSRTAPAEGREGRRA